MTIFFRLVHHSVFATNAPLPSFTAPQNLGALLPSFWRPLSSPPPTLHGCCWSIWKMNHPCPLTCPCSSNLSFCGRICHSCHHSHQTWDLTSLHQILPFPSPFWPRKKCSHHLHEAVHIHRQHSRARCLREVRRDNHLVASLRLQVSPQPAPRKMRSDEGRGTA